MIKKLLLGLLLTSTILTGCGMTKAPSATTTENIETTTEETTTVENETEDTTTSAEAPTEPPTTWEEAINWVTKEDVKAEFDRIQIPESIQRVIFDNEAVIVTLKDNIYYGKETPFLNVMNSFEETITHFSSIRAVDVDWDGKNELIMIAGPSHFFKYGEDVVLKEGADGKVYIYWYGSRYITVSTTGYFYGNELYSGNGYMYKLVFEGNDVHEEKVAWMDDGFFIEGNKVTREEFDEFIKPNKFFENHYNDWSHMNYMFETN